ncbi:glycoside hydrolase family 97 catalytic domain-containing protein [Pedobacter sp. AW1-32]|uniref:glycoside hydrolase family 97 catalytic domain-containing protein n=1 Tax=Pedobacter sp. AW1-32 TaxID=3383026 RepID=UPI003FED621E
MNDIKSTMVLCLLCLAFNLAKAQQKTEVSSPDGKLSAQVFIENNTLMYRITREGKTVIEASKLGLLMENKDFRSFKSIETIGQRKIREEYPLVGKKAKAEYIANGKTFKVNNLKNESLHVVFQVSDDAVAFKYQFTNAKKQDIKQEETAFNFPEETNSWLQPMQVSKSGWEQTNPAYEEHYNIDVPLSKVGENKTGWVYPALFKTPAAYVLLTEAGLEGNYCATRLLSSAVKGKFNIGFPDEKEILPEVALLPSVAKGFDSPWRVLTIGNLANLVESTAGTDLAKPNVLGALNFVKPGKASWSWINSKDDFIVYDEQKKYIDFAAKMHWQYCLIDVNWDEKIGYEKMQELADYARTKHVGLLLWYNSAGNWNTVKYTPKGQLLTHEDREKTFSRLQKMGIAGVKIDFFAGDGRSVIQYYLDILKDAAAHQLMVNFHGATLPRGWARTYPNLLTAEAVRGFENVTFTLKDADREAEICTMLPFARNVFDPMDYTPMNLYKIPTQVKRKTSSAFQLALSVLFTSGIQHYAESPGGMMHVSENVQDFLRTLPDSWTDSKFIAGQPGEYVVIARKSDKKWYIAGISNTSEHKINLDLKQFGAGKVIVYQDGTEHDPIVTESKEADKNFSITVKPNSGFVLVFE